MRITANKIDGWANTADCRVKLPLLIRKLIHENIKDLSKCKFPSLEQTTSSSGFDGILESNEETQYVPKGVSVWEMGCNKDKSKKRKANEDYKKRKEDPLNTAPKETVYIQVSPRVWKDEKIKEWCDEKNQDNFWKDVILLDAKDLEEWINNTPSVEQWFAEELGFPNEGVQTLSNWWDNWCKTDEFKIHPSLILTDREDDSTRLLNHLTENNNINVKASNLEEGIAFLYSVIDPLEDKDKFLDRCLVIDNKQTLKYYLNSDNLILIPTFDYKEHNDSNNMIYRPLLDSDPSGAEIELEDPQKSSFAKSLENIGIPYHEAKRYAANSGGNITILKRLLSSDITNPEWLNDEYIEVLITIFFMQSWNESEDSIIIEKLSNRSFDDFTQKCEQLLDKADTPLVKINTKWFLKSPKDLLFFISKRITDRYLNRFEEVILKLFDNANKSKFSFNLKRGMSKSMILISVHAENFKRCSKDLQYFIDGIIYNLNEDLSNFWVYNSSFLKFFAEASPQLFITLLKQTLIESPDETTGSTHSRCYINNSSNLLWALERISFDSILFEDIVWILVELSHLPFNKRYIPNPINTLKELFIPWKVNTNTPLDYRIKILKDILTDDFGIGWEILTLLLSRGAEFSFQTSECYWRYTLNLKLTDEDINEYNEHLEDLLLDFAGNNSDRWCFIFEYYKRSSKESKDKILTRFNLIKDNLDDKNTVWNKLRDILGWYSDRFKDKKDFRNEIHAIESLFDELKPSEFIEQISWAFDSGFPRTPEGLYIDRGAKLEEIRNSSIKELFKKQGFEGIRDLINIVKEPQLIANYCLGFDFDDDVINLLNGGESCLNFSGHYIFQKSKDNPNWAMGFVLKVKENNPDKLGIVLIALHSNKETWCIVEDCDSHIQDYYWLNCRQYFGSEISEIEYYMDKLFNYSRYDDIILTLYHNVKILSPEYVEGVLIKISEKADDEREFDSFLIESLLEFLHQNDYDSKRLIQLELNFASCFDEFEFEKTLCIHEEFSKNPEFFCDIVKQRFEKVIGYEYPYTTLLSTWKILPGAKGNAIDKDYLYEWVEQCCELLDGEDMIYAYLKIGNLLGIFEENKNNCPCEDVCEILETFNNEKINEGFNRGFSSMRINTSESKLSGADFENIVAKDYERFYRENMAKYPVVSKLLHSLSIQFKNQAKRLEISSQLREWEQD